MTGQWVHLTTPSGTVELCQRYIIKYSYQSGAINAIDRLLMLSHNIFLSQIVDSHFCLV